MEAVEAGKGGLAAIDTDDDKDEDDNDDSDCETKAKAKKHSEKDEEREAARATVSARIDPLEWVAQDKKNAAQAADAAAKASRRELDALRAQQNSTFCPAETLGKQEIIVVYEGLAYHKHVSTTLASFSN